MTEPVERATPPLRTWRPMAAWLAVTTVLLALVWPCWRFASSLLETRSLVVRHMREKVDLSILGTPEVAIARLESFASGPRYMTLARDDESDRNLRWEATKIIGKFGAPAINSLIRLLSYKEEVVRAEAARALGDIGPEARDAVPHLMRMLSAPTQPGWAHNAQVAAAAALGGIGPDARVAIPLLAEALKDDDTSVRITAASVLFSFGEAAKSEVPELTAALQDESPGVREMAIRTLGRIGPPAESATSQLAARLLEEEHYYTRQCAADALGNIGPGAKDAVPSLIKALQDKRSEVSISAAAALGKMGRHAESAIPALGSASSDGVSGLSAKEALEKIRAAVAEEAKDAKP